MDAKQQSQFLAASEAAERCCTVAGGLHSVLSVLGTDGNLLAARACAHDLCKRIREASPVLNFLGVINETYSDPSSIVSAWGTHYDNAHAAAVGLSRELLFFVELYATQEPRMDGFGEMEKHFDTASVLHDGITKDARERLRKLAREGGEIDSSEIAARIKRERAAVLQERQPSRPFFEDKPQWSEADSPTRWAKRFKISKRTFKRRCEDGGIRYKKLSDRSYQVDMRDAPVE